MHYALHYSSNMLSPEHFENSGFILINAAHYNQKLAILYTICLFSFGPVPLIRHCPFIMCYSGRHKRCDRFPNYGKQNGRLLHI